MTVIRRVFGYCISMTLAVKLHRALRVTLSKLELEVRNLLFVGFRENVSFRCYFVRNERETIKNVLGILIASVFVK